MMNDSILRGLKSSQFMKKLCMYFLKENLDVYRDTHRYYNNLDEAGRKLTTQQKKHWLCALNSIEDYEAVLLDLEETPSCLLH